MWKIVEGSSERIRVSLVSLAIIAVSAYILL